MEIHLTLPSSQGEGGTAETLSSAFIRSGVVIIPAQAKEAFNF
jgi:hypothetical protein